MYAERHEVQVTTDGSGDGEGYTPVLTGRIQAIHYVKDDYANGVDFAVTAEATGESIWSENDVNASSSRAPRQATHAPDGSAALYAAGGLAVRDHITLANDRVKLVVASGGANKAGTFHVIVG